MRASIVVPTTGDRGPLLPHSVGSALAQTVDDVEVLVIGDGIDEATRDVVRELGRADERVRCFEFAKDARRGELNRHAVLTEHARGRIVTYLCDRDLYLPGHVEELERVLADADFGHTLRFRVAEDGTATFPRYPDLLHPDERARLDRSPYLAPLTFVGHTMAAYRALPHGWRTTPAGTATDRYMWEQFLAAGARVGVSHRPTALTFKRGDHPGWSTQQRLVELEDWSARLRSPTVEREVVEQVIAGLERRRLELERRAWARSLEGGADRLLPGDWGERAVRVARDVRSRLRRRPPRQEGRPPRQEGRPTRQ
ncbi:MAG: glycosyltransferase family A protein [Actinomycetota bacterium]